MGGLRDSSGATFLLTKANEVAKKVTNFRMPAHILVEEGMEINRVNNNEQNMA